MSGRDIFTDVAAILHPIPRPEPGKEDRDGFLMMRDEAIQDQDRTAQQLRLSSDDGDQDPLIGALADARRRKEAAEQEIRELLAYGREFVQPRPYTLGDLAAASGLSISSVRTAYGHRDVDAVTSTTGSRPRKWRAADPTPDNTDSIDGEVPA